MTGLADRLDRLFEGSEIAIRLALPESVNCPARLRDRCLVRHYPLIECFAAVSVVIGQGGYNLAHEVQTCGVPHLLIARRRKYDHQHQRKCAFETFPDPESLAVEINSRLSRPIQPALEYTNGASLAAMWIHRHQSVTTP